MSNINLALNFGLPSGAIAARVAYARVDNLPSGGTPTYTTVSPDLTSSPGIVATNIPNGQYLMSVLLIYPDLRVCNPEYVYTDACPGLISINAYITSGQLVVQYLAPSDVPKVRITVNYPNGGSFTQNYVNDGNNIVIPFPSGVYGDFQVSGQSVCDETSGFYSAPSAQVTVSRTVNNTTISNTATGITIITVNNITGFTLPQSVTAGNTVQGNHTAFYASINASFTGTPAGTSSATLSINGTIIQCVAVPNTNGGIVTFNAASVADSDLISVAFSSGSCP